MKISLHLGNLYEEGQTGITVWDEFWLAQVVKVQWEQIWDPWLGKGAFSGPSLKVVNVWWDGMGEQTSVEAEPGLSQPEQRRREITWTWWLEGVEIPVM